MKHIKSLLLLLLLMLANSVYATSFLAPMNTTAGDVASYQTRLPFVGTEFDREAYESIGIVNIVIQNEENMLEAGEYWITYLVDSTGQRVSWTMTFSAHVSPADDDAICVYYGIGDSVDLNGYRQCAMKDLGNGEWEVVALFGRNWLLACEKPDDYTIVVEHFLGTDEELFTLSDYVPAEPLINDLPDLVPKVASSKNYVTGITTPGFLATDYTVIIDIVDNQDCGIKLPDIEVEIKNTIITESGDHLHFKDANEVGAGEYTSSIPKWVSATDKNTTITVKSDTDGRISAIYRAGIYGADETLTATAHVPDSDRAVSATKDFSIKVPDLVKIPEDGTYDFSGYDSNTDCDQNHNPSTTVRSGVYVTPFTEVMLGYLNLKWLALGGTKLCLNDGSLENGGFFDEGLTNDRTTQCHGSHRMGIDVDITMAATACTENLATGEIMYKGETIKKSKLFWALAKKIGAFKPKSDHVRFGR